MFLLLQHLLVYSLILSYFLCHFYFHHKSRFKCLSRYTIFFIHSIKSPISFSISSIFFPIILSSSLSFQTQVFLHISLLIYFFVHFLSKHRVSSRLILSFTISSLLYLESWVLFQFSLLEYSIFHFPFIVYSILSLTLSTLSSFFSFM